MKRAFSIEIERAIANVLLRSFLFFPEILDRSKMFLLMLQYLFGLHVYALAHFLYWEFVTYCLFLGSE